MRAANLITGAVLVICFPIGLVLLALRIRAWRAGEVPPRPSPGGRATDIAPPVYRRASARAPDHILQWQTAPTPYGPWTDVDRIHFGPRHRGPKWTNPDDYV